MKVKGNLSVVVGWTVYGDRQVTVQITASRGRRHRHVCQSVSVHSKKKIKIHLSFSHSYLLKHLKLSSWYRLEPFHSKWDKYAGFMFYSVSCINTASVLFVRKKKKVLKIVFVHYSWNLRNVLPLPPQKILLRMSSNLLEDKKFSFCKEIKKKNQLETLLHLLKFK